MRTTTYLASKPRYEILDGLRGVAALIVVAFHLFETYSTGTLHQILNHGYLAVDFFFVLSGFVIGYAYDDRWDRMSLTDFFKRRLVRLHPLLIWGTLIGALVFYFGEGDVFPLIGQTPWWMVVVMCIWGFTMIPAPTSLDIRGWGETNCLNGATWSLMWEYLANILYALVIRHFSKWLLGIFVFLSGVLTVMLCFNMDVFGVLAVRDYAAYTVNGGWCLSPDQLLIGITRLSYPFLVGLLIAKVGKYIALKGGFWWCSLMIVTMLVMPRIGGSEAMWANGMYEAVCILLLFPLVVMMGAGSKVTGKKSYALCKFLGDISYPLYITHFPFIYMQNAWGNAHRDLPTSTHVMVAVGIYILVICVAYASLKLYDEPVREWLKHRFFMKKK